MKHKIIKNKALRITLIYLVIGVLWILFSDHILLYLTNNYELAAEYQTYKGSFYVVVTAILLYYLINRELLILRKLNNELEKNHQILSEAQQALKANRDKFKNLIEQAGDAIFHGNLSGDFIEVNSAASHLTGFSRNELLSMNMKDLFDDEVLSKDPLKYEKLNAGSTIVCERLMTRKEGRQLPIEMNSKKLDDNSYISIIRDVSERKRNEEELKKYRNNLEQQVKERTHEINQRNKELESKNQELEKFNKLFIDREFRIKELKDQIEELKTQNK